MTSPEAADRLGHQLAMRLRAAYSRLRRSSNLVFASFEMTSDQYVLLTVLAHEGEATQQELVQRCYSDTATLGTMVALLEAKGFVARAPHPHDGRARTVRLTPSGRALAADTWRSSSALRISLVRLFQERELLNFMACLERLAGAMIPPGRKSSASRRRQPRRRTQPGVSTKRTS